MQALLTKLQSTEEELTEQGGAVNGGVADLAMCGPGKSGKSRRSTYKSDIKNETTTQQQAREPQSNTTFCIHGYTHVNDVWLSW